MTAPTYLSDRTDPRVVVALTRKCTICGAKPDNDCTWNGKPLNRIVHLCRAEAHMDRKSKRDE